MKEPKTNQSKTYPNMHFCIILFCIAALFETVFWSLTIQVWDAQSIFIYLGLTFALQINACIKAIYVWHIIRYSIKTIVYINCAIITGLLAYLTIEAVIALTMSITPAAVIFPISGHSVFFACTDALLSVVLLYSLRSWLGVILKSEPLQLSSQIRHHFLFNTLNTTVCQIKENPELAQANLERLADLFRKILFQKVYISLEEELVSVKTYLEIEKYRLGKRLQVRWFLDYRTNVVVKMPALTLQPLVENAIYHGIEKIVGGGIIVISIYTVKNRLIIQVSNPIDTVRLSDLSLGNHIAQNNIERRLALIYGNNFSFEREQGDTEYRATIKIPIGELL